MGKLYPLQYRSYLKNAEMSDAEFGGSRLFSKIGTNARALHRQAQLRWDWIEAENSTGFHNPPEALYVLGQSIELARKAELTARRATGK